LLFFQAALLVGYGWAHLSTTRLGLRRQPWSQVGLLLLPLVVLPIAVPAWAVPPDDVAPSLWLLAVLVAMVGAPYVAVTTASPVLQRWFSATDHPHASDPYFLYAMGNAGSLAGLLAYPFVIEPNLTLTQQSWLWAGGYVAFFALTVGAAWLLRRHRAGEAPDRSATDPATEATPATARPLAARRRLGWVAMAFVPSSLMLGATTYISADLAAVPLLWVLPLSIYLVTFILAFSPRNPLTPDRMAALLPIAVVVLAAVLVGAVSLPLAVLVAINLGVFFVAALLAHGRLAADRPEPARLTEFYVLLAVGGALGGVFNALVAPVIFDSVLEYPLAIVLALLLRPGRSAADQARERRERRLDLLVPTAVFVGTLAGLAILSRTLGASQATLALALAGLAVGLLVLIPRPVRFALSMGVVLAIPLLVGQSTLFADRSFFGVNRVVEQDTVRLLVHGTTTHGGQRQEPDRAREPLTYYHRTGPFGMAMWAIQTARPEPLRMGVIGLGAGGIAAYVRPGDSIVFMEIDPVVIRIAEDPTWFTLLSGAPGDVRVVPGDGRLTLAEEPDGSFDVLVVDAFSGDAPPAHLLTVEAMDLYTSKLSDDGVLLFNVTNRYVEVGSVVAAGLRDRGLPIAIPADGNPGVPAPPEKEPSGWIATATDVATLDALLGEVDAGPMRLDDTRPWTDEYSDLVSVIRWGG
jgi:hypothetical protein